jgi:hypothetical protein
MVSALLTFMGLFTLLMYKLVALVHLEKNPFKWPYFDQSAFLAVMVSLCLLGAFVYVGSRE